MKSSNRHTLVILFLTFFTVMVGFGVIMPILPYYAENMGATATALGLLTATYATLQFFFAPIWGKLSDKIGRKPVLLLGLFGFTFTFFGFGISTQLWMLFLSRGLSGLLSSATMPTVMAYIADTTNEEDRGSGMGLIGSAMGLGMIFGPVIGGFLGAINASAPFFFASALAFVVAVSGLIFLPESLSTEAREAARQGSGQRGGVFNTFSTLAGPLGYLMILALLTSFGMAQLESTSALFYERKFGAGEAEMGVIFMVMGICSSLTQGVLVGRVIKKLGEPRTIQIGLVGTAATYLFYPLIFNFTSALVIIIVMGVVSSFLRPALNSFVSKRADPSQQGAILGVVNSYYSLGRVAGPIMGGLIFDYMGMSWPYLSASLIFFLAYGLSFVLLFHKKGAKSPVMPHAAND